MMLLAGLPPDHHPHRVAQMPHVRRFLDGWGRPGDVGVLAVDETGREKAH